MPQPPTLKIAEIFSSIQGEGLRQGEAALFVRLSGCNLHCSFCDTKYAWQGGEELTCDEVIRRIIKMSKRFPARWVCLTGGEPLLQDVAELVRKLKREGFHVQVETNATFYRPMPVDWYSISPKPEDYFFRSEYRQKAKEVKLVVTRELGISVIQRLRKEFPDHTPLLLQPQSNRKWSMVRAKRLLEKALSEGLKNIRLGIQLHRIFGLR